MNEEWRDIPGWKGYEVSNFGNVRGKVVESLKQFRNGPKKELSVKLSAPGGIQSTIIVARLVAICFIPVPDVLWGGNSRLRIVHKDSNLDNNRVENLEWAKFVSRGRGVQPGEQRALKHGKYVGLYKVRQERSTLERIEGMLRKGWKRVVIAERLRVHPSLVDQIAVELVLKEKARRERGLE